MVMCDDWSCFEYCNLDGVPHVAGVYFLMNDNELVYIGQSINIHNRVLSHKTNFNCTIFDGGKPIFPDMFNGLYFFECGYKPERKEYEKLFHDDYFPKLNGIDWSLGERRMLNNKMSELERKNLIKR